MYWMSVAHHWKFDMECSNNLLIERDPVVAIHEFDSIVKIWQKYKIIQVSSLSLHVKGLFWVYFYSSKIEYCISCWFMSIEIIYSFSICHFASENQ